MTDELPPESPRASRTGFLRPGYLSAESNPDTGRIGLPSLSRRTRVIICISYPAIHFFSIWFGVLSQLGGNTATFWLSNGLLFAALVVIGTRWWLPLLAAAAGGEVMVNLVLPRFDWFAPNAYFIAANFLESILAAILWQVLIRDRNNIFSLRNALLFVMVLATVPPATSAAVAALGRSSFSPDLGFFAFWQTWFFSDALGILIIAGAALAWSGASKDYWRQLAARKVELMLLTATVLGVSVFLFSAPPGRLVAGSTSVFYVLLLWSVVRFDIRVATVIILPICAVAIYFTDIGAGPFVIGNYSIHDRVESLQWLLSSCAIVAVIMGAIFLELQSSNTLLSESRNKFEKVFRASSHAICVCRAADGRVLEANPGFLKLVGCSVDEAVGKSVTDLGLPAFDPNEPRGEAGSTEETTQFVMSDAGSGVEKVCQLTHDFADIQGERCIIYVVSDLTTIKQQEKKQRALERDLMQAGKMEAIGQLTGGIAHDFNNILFSIAGSADLARRHVESKQDPTLSGYLEEICEGSERASELVDQILTFGSARPAVEESVDVGGVVDKSVRLLQRVMPSGLTIRSSVDVGGAGFDADPLQLQRVIMNLCINARDATDGRGTVDLEVDVAVGVDARCDSCNRRFNGNFIRLTVRDSGPGFDAEAVPRIFDPFYSSKKPGQGSGLGLSVVHGVVHGHQGHITLQGMPGANEISAYFPSHDDDWHPSGRTHADTAELTQERPLKGRLVVVDDDPAVLRVVTRLFEVRGLAVVAMTSAAEALEYIEANRDQCDVVVTDQTMPGMTGVELAKILSKTAPDLPVLLCTGLMSEQSKAEAMVAGIRGIYQKPIDMKRLLPDIAALLKS